MDCREAEEHIAAYLLGTLGPRGTYRLKQHVDTCVKCGLKLREDGDMAAQLACVVPQLEAPHSVKRQLFSRVDAESAGHRTAWPLAAWQRILRQLDRGLAAQPGLAMASMLIGIIALGGFWFSSRLNTIEDLKEALAAQVETVAENEAEMKEMVRNQRYLTYMMASSPGASVTTLSGTEMAAHSLGMVVVEATGTSAILSALDLPTLPEGKVYRVWLIKGDQEYDTGVLAVDSTGYVQKNIELSAPMAEFSAVKVTIEREEGSPGPTGDSVLRGDL